MRREFELYECLLVVAVFPAFSSMSRTNFVQFILLEQFNLMEFWYLRQKALSTAQTSAKPKQELSYRKQIARQLHEH